MLSREQRLYFLCLICLVLRFEVGPEGIKGYDFWSRPYRTGWESITDVQEVSMLGLNYLRFDVRDSRTCAFDVIFTLSGF